MPNRKKYGYVTQWRNRWWKWRDDSEQASGCEPIYRTI